MAFSQKHEGKCLVPWFCSAEWHLVYNNIYNSNSNAQTKRKALDIINIWKARTPFLNRGLEGTFIILEAALIDRTIYDDYNLKLILSTSILRFLNICAAYNKSQGTFYATACKAKIPEWMVDMRHVIAHGQNLPSLDLLDRALNFSIEWLHAEYWKPAALEMKDFIDNTQFASDKKESLRNILQPLISNYCYITLLTHKKWNYNIIQDIVDEDIRNTFIEEMRMMVNENINENSELSEILETLWNNIEDILKDYNDLEDRYLVLAELLLEDVFLGDIDDREDIFKEQNKVPRDFIFLWENLLQNFKTDMFNALIEKLLSVLLVDKISHNNKIVAATWLSEIGRGIDKCVYVRSIIRELAKTGSKPRKFIESVVSEKLGLRYNNKKILNFNSNVGIPDIISDCSKFQKFILQDPTKYTKIFILELLNLNKSLKSQDNKKNILELLKLYTLNDEKFVNIEPDPISEIHSVEELDSLTMETDVQTEQKIDGSSNTDEIVITNKKWRKVTENNFEKCPIGILPWQSTAMNPFLL